jgi:hypothetical protein
MQDGIIIVALYALGMGLSSTSSAGSAPPRTHSRTGEHARAPKTTG